MNIVKLRTIKSRIIIIMTVFSLVITTILSFFTYEMISYYQRKTAVQAAEFNLQLVAHIIEKDLANLQNLVMVNSTNSPTNTMLVNYFTSEQATAMDSIHVFNAMQEAYRTNHANHYVRRLIVMDAQQRFLHLDNAVSASTPLTKYNLDAFDGLDLTTTEQWSRVVKDPLSTSKGIPFIFPIYNNADRIGTIYLLADTSVFTDKFVGYALPEDSKMLLTLNQTQYEIRGKEIVEHTDHYINDAYIYNYSTGAHTSVSRVRTEDGAKLITVSYPIITGVSLTQTLAFNQLMPLTNVWLILMLGLSCLIILLSGIIMVYLTKTISNPVEKLKKRMDKIAQGQFFVDKMIEWDNEIGDVGRGINKLSRDIVTMMESRLANEKQKQELEYRMLQNQINPHFLYNTLNSIKWMATIQNASGIAEMTTSLSRLLRNITKDMRKLVPLHEELSLLDDYFLIQKYRYGSMITLEKEIVSEQLLQCYIPRFTLQPIVENAIFHGIEPKGTSGKIVVRVERINGTDFIVSVMDNGIGLNEEQIDALLQKPELTSSEHQPHVGLQSVHERLRLSFGEHYGITIESEPNVYTKMIIKLPIQEIL